MHGPDGMMNLMVVRSGVKCFEEGAIWILRWASWSAAGFMQASKVDSPNEACQARTFTHSFCCPLNFHRCPLIILSCVRGLFLPLRVLISQTSAPVSRS